MTVSKRNNCYECYSCVLNGEVFGLCLTVISGDALRGMQRQHACYRGNDVTPFTHTSTAQCIYWINLEKDYTTQLAAKENGLSIVRMTVGNAITNHASALSDIRSNYLT